MNNYNPFSLSGKTVLITGASSGIGQATAVECSRAGADLVINARNEERLRKCKDLLMGGVNCKTIIADLTVDDDMDALVEALPELDGAVVCAGIGQTMPVKMAKPEMIKRIFETNFFANVELVRLLFKKKKLRRGASVVVLASIGGTRIFENGGMMYGTSKAALNSFVKFAAKEFAPRMVRVNALCPGMVETPLIHDGGNDAELADYVAKYPLGRFGRPEEIAYAAIYLLSEASAWVTGTSIIIDGGSTINS